MTMGNSAAFDIDDVLRQPQLLRDCDRHGGKGFVDLNPLDIGERPACPIQRLAYGRDRTEAEQPRLNGRHAVAGEPSKGLDPLRLGEATLIARFADIRQSDRVYGRDR
jgi:hypothetical protein